MAGNLRDDFAVVALKASLNGMTRLPALATALKEQADRTGVDVKDFVAEDCYAWAGAMMRARVKERV